MLNSKFLGILFFVLLFTHSLSWGASYHAENMIEVSIGSNINPVTLEYLTQAYQKAKEFSSPVVLLKLNTPGGHVNITKKIITLIGEADFPTLIWITPEGAGAISAGAIIASSAHLIFMSEATTIGAATPVSLTGDIQNQDQRSKAINDLLSLVTSLCESRGRQAEPFKQMVEKAKTFTATEALKLSIIDHKANHLNEILSKASGSFIKIKGSSFTLTLPENIKVQSIPMSFMQNLFNQFASPTTAYIFFMIGAALIFLEIKTAGGFIAGSIGSLFLIIAAIGFQIISLNLGALAIILASFIFFIMEIYITSYGILSIIGLCAMYFGSTFLFETDQNYLFISQKIFFSAVTGVGLFIAFIAYYFIKSKKSPSAKDIFTLEDSIGMVVSMNEDIKSANFHYQVRVSGEIWRAMSSSKLQIGEKIKVTGSEPNQLILIVKRYQP